MTPAELADDLEAFLAKTDETFNAGHPYVNSRCDLAECVRYRRDEIISVLRRVEKLEAALEFYSGGTMSADLGERARQALTGEA